MKGFLGTGASFRADLNLIVQIGMGIMLLVGAILARRKSFRAHKYCQSSVMLLNLVMIGLIMFPSFNQQVEPHISEAAHDRYHGVALGHALLGGLAELLGLYIVLVAATKILPQKLRFNRYRPWMRTELTLWWVVVLIGLGTYWVWYLAPERTTPAASAAVVTQKTPSAPAATTITISNFKFDPAELTVPAGTTVEWVDNGGRHSVVADDGSFKSDTLTAGIRFMHKFDKPGRYQYYCDFHGSKGGKDMAGLVVVTP
ncbi:MAG TPA: DUF420 domain-containing protein [Blastocatellia bacterium]|nr:DUF420 domain-containing protein [Blastocatellia bacterium]